MNGTDISTLLGNKATPYKATAKMDGGAIDTSTSVVEGDTEGGLFSTQKELDKMDFLKLLTTQLQFQDPSSPMENTEFVSQLAQFSALEGTTNVEKAVSRLEQAFSDSLGIQNANALSTTNASAVSLIGKDIRLQQNSVSFSGVQGETRDIRVHLGNKTKATVEIVDFEGKVLRTMEATGKDSQNSGLIQWNGITDDGTVAKAGNYGLRIVGQESDPSLYCYTEGKVEGIRYGASGPMIKVNGQELPIGNIKDISPSVQKTTEKKSLIDSTNVFTLIGKNIQFQQSNVSYEPGKGSIKVNADFMGAHSGTLNVKDASGNVVKTIPLNKANGGFSNVEIEKLNYNNNGPYTVELADGQKGYLYAEAKVEGVNTHGGELSLRISGQNIALAKVMNVF